MSPVDALLTAGRSLRANLLRSALTMLGIIIGVGSVVVMISVGQGAERSVTDFIRSLGSNLIVVTPGSSRTRGAAGGAGSTASLTLNDAQAIEDYVENVLIVASSVTGRAQVISGNQNWNTMVNGIGRGYFDARNWELWSGRLFSGADLRGTPKLAVLGKSVADILFPYADPIGRSVRINRVPFRVIGVLAPKGQSSFGTDQDDVVFVPLNTAKRRLFGIGQQSGNEVSVITVKVATADAMSRVEQDIRLLLRDRHNLRTDAEDDFRITNFEEILETSSQTTRIMTLPLAAIGSISLIVGGIGIMNIMLVSVTERTREIGLRMAIGARQRDIQSQFLIEAITLSTIGGVIGIVFGMAGAIAIAGLAGWPAEVSALSIVLSAGFAAAIGVFFGLYPALRAARLNPIEALRSE